MEILKTLWPTPFKIKPKDLGSFIGQLIVFALVCVVFSILIGILSVIPIVGWIFGILGGLVDIYCVVGIVLCILKFANALK